MKIKVKNAYNKTKLNLNFKSEIILRKFKNKVNIIQICFILYCIVSSAYLFAVAFCGFCKMRQKSNIFSHATQVHKKHKLWKKINCACMWQRATPLTESENSKKQMLVVTAGCCKLLAKERSNNKEIRAKI